MLIGINPIISPSLLKILAEMGHGDELVLADAHFPGHTFCGEKVIHSDGLQIPDLLEGIIPLFQLDQYDTNLMMMAAVEGDTLDPTVESTYVAAIRKHATYSVEDPLRIERFAFYERARKAYACVITGTTAKYGNLILKKGVTAC